MDYYNQSKEIAETNWQQNAALFKIKKKAAAEKVVKWPSKVITTACKEVESHGDLREQITRMTELLVLLEGVGIAANQAGYDNRVCLCWFNARTEHDLVLMINPVIERTIGPMHSMKEGCLSTPGCICNVRRYNSVWVTWEDEDGLPHSQVFEGWNARIVQHELDHLDGTVILNKQTQVDKARNKNYMEHLQIQAGIVPKRFAKKGMVLKKNDKGS